MLDKKIKNELNIIKKHILSTTPVEKIILHGSYASENFSKDSDLDIFVVIPDTVKKRPLDIMHSIRATINNNIPVDLMIEKQQKYNTRKTEPTLERVIERDGIVLYG